MSQTTQTSSHLATAHIQSVSEDAIVLHLHHSSYKISLKPVGSVHGLTHHQRVTGTIRAQAQRVDVAGTGGKYIEPVYGRPRRIQGRIIGGSVADNTIVVDCGLPFVCKLMDLQKAADFSLHQFVGFDIESGATFELAQ